MINKYTPHLKQLILFGVVGVITLAIDVGVSAILFYGTHLPAYLSSGIGFLSGFFFNFPMNRKRVFHHSDRDRFQFHTQVVFYITLSLFNLIITSYLVELMVNNNLLPIQYAKIIVTGLIATWNFLLFKFFIFSKTKNNAE
jgi:putative flippase GtrA